MPSVSTLISLIRSFFHFSGMVYKSDSITQKNPYLDFMVNYSVMVGIIWGFVAIEILYFSLFVLNLSRVSKTQSLKMNTKNLYLLSVLRLVLSKILFLPIFHLLSFTVSCHYYEDLGAWRSTLSKDLGCILSYPEQFRTNQGNLILLSTMALIWHIMAGVGSEVFDFSFVASSPFNHPK